MYCPVCKLRKHNWMHELSCRELNRLAWLLFDFIRATTSEFKQQAVKRYWGLSNDNG